MLEISIIAIPFIAQIPFSAKFFWTVFAKRLKLTQHHNTARNFILHVINQRRLQSYRNEVRPFVCI